MLEIDVRSGDIPSVRVNFMHDGEPREYKECRAYHENGLVLIVHYRDHPLAVPRAVFTADQVFVEHFGPHPHPPLKRGQRPQSQKEVLKTPEEMQQIFEERDAQSNGEAKEGRTPEQILADLEKFPSAAEQRGTREYLESNTAAADPKEVSESSTEEESGSVPPLLETPSGKFMTRPLPEERPKVELAKEHSYGTAISSTVIEPTAISKSSRTGGRKRRGNHGRPRQLPGAMALLAVALFLSLSFRRSF